MKTIDGHELTVISDVVFELEHKLEYYGDDMEPDCKKELEDAISTLNGILKKPDFAPEVKYVYVEKLLNPEQVQERIEMAVTYGRELVNPNFKYCVFNTDSTVDGIFLTDDFEKALLKAKSLSLVGHGFYTVYEIKQSSDGTYKTYSEETYHDGQPLGNRYGKEFLHFDYLAKMSRKIIKM